MLRILADSLLLATLQRPARREPEPRYPSRRPDRPAWEAPDHWLR